MRKQELSKKMSKAIDDFDDAAQQWGYQQDQGVPPDMYQYEANYDMALRRLKILVRRLEEKVKMK